MIFPFLQLRVILKNRTGIEEWIVSKAESRRTEADPPFVYPYNLGRWKNFTQVTQNFIIMSKLWAQNASEGSEGMDCMTGKKYSSLNA